MDGWEDGDGQGFDMQPVPMGQQQQPAHMVGNLAPDGSQMPGMSAGSMYPDEATLGAGEDTNDAKRRRIARVRNRCQRWLGYPTLT